ncbi:aurora kinase-like [Apostichopus japonicus]|uniref:aurora kinase-like n=1 Tax=Stichopus japonicus TaxID=307972 RepID=UPI003AB21EA4
MGRKLFRRRQVKNKQNRQRGRRSTLNKIFWWFACLRSSEQDGTSTDVSQDASTIDSYTSSGGSCSVSDSEIIKADHPSDVTISIDDPCTGSYLSSQDTKSSDELYVSSVCERMGLSNVPYIPPGDLEEVEDEWGMPIFLGGGGNGAVQLMRIKSTQVLCAVKTQYKHLNEETAGQNFASEVRVLKALQGLQCIPTFFGVTLPQDDGPFPAIVQEFVRNGQSYTATSLYDATEKCLITKDNYLQVAIDICLALRDMHSRYWLHCDIKSDNIMLQTSSVAHDTVNLWDDVDSVASWEPTQDIYPTESNPNFKIKLIDFGLTLNMNDQEQYLKFTDERQAEVLKNSIHVAPEVITGQRPFSKASDVFSIGRVLKDLSVVGDDFLLSLGDQCMKLNPDERPKLDDVIDIINVRIQSVKKP